MLLLLLLFDIVIKIHTNSVLVHNEEINPEFSMLIVDRINKKFIVAGTNRLFMFDSLLQRLQTVSTGPMVVNCNASNYNDEKNICGIKNNYPRVLAILPHNQQLLFCGTVNDGLCSLHILNNMNKWEYFNENNELNYLGNNSNAVVATLGESLYVAKRHDDGGGGRLPALSHLELDVHSKMFDLKFKHNEPLRHSYLKFSSKYENNYIVNYIGSFKHGKFIYFLTVQREYVNSRKYHSKLVRWCQGDSNFTSYTELALSCVFKPPRRKQQQVFNIAQSMFFFRQEQGHSSLHVAMLHGRAPGKVTSGSSVVCSYDMHKVEDRFIAAQRDCHSGKGELMAWVHEQKPRCQFNVCSILGLNKNI